MRGFIEDVVGFKFLENFDNTVPKCYDDLFPVTST